MYSWARLSLLSPTSRTGAVTFPRKGRTRRQLAAQTGSHCDCGRLKTRQTVPKVSDEAVILSPSTSAESGRWQQDGHPVRPGQSMQPGEAAAALAFPRAKHAVGVPAPRHTARVMSRGLASLV